MPTRAMLLRKRARSLFPSRWTSLRARMTITYVLVTVAPVFCFSLLIVLLTGVLSLLFPPSNALPSDFLTSIQRQANTYATIAAYQAQSQGQSQGAALDPRTSFDPGQAHTIAVAYQSNQGPDMFAPYISTNAPDPASVAIALLVAPDGRLLASSYPARYPAGMPVSTLTAAQARAIDQALAGQASTGTEHLSAVTLGYAAEPVWSQDHRPIGAVFLRVPGPLRDGILSRLWSALSSALLLLLTVTPIGLFFGWIATRGLVGRVQRLVAATAKFAGGDYSQRVPSAQNDEIGQLERQFNQMAGQLVENISRRQQLAEQNARLQERSRISRELHDAISQDLFSLRMLSDGLHEAARAGSSSADLQPHIALLEQTTGSMTREMRALLLELRPTQLENLDLAGALRELAHAYSTRLGITVTADVRLRSERSLLSSQERKHVTLNVKTEHALLRIAQEALANAARHSGATLISLSLASDDDTVMLTITDNGAGFPTDEPGDGYGLGLRIMRERAEELHGAFDIQTAPGQGTRIVVTVPAQPAAPAEGEHTDD